MRCTGQSGPTFNFLTVAVGGLLVLVAAALLLAALGAQRGGGVGARMMQNSTQLRGIHQGLFTYAQSNKTGGRDGWYPGLDARGQTFAVADVLPAGELGASQDVPGYAADRGDDVVPANMNATPTRGFVTRAAAELLAGDFIPAGSGAYFIAPQERLKHPFEADGGSPFTSANLSYSLLDVSRTDGGVSPLKQEWKEAIRPEALIAADRAIGDGSDLATRSSVWTEPGSGNWRGSVVYNDGSTRLGWHAEQVDLRYGDKDFRVDAPEIDNPFSDAFTLQKDAAGRTQLSVDSGLLYDEADSGTDADAF